MGDVEAACIAHEAIGKLLGVQLLRGALVVDLIEERRRREG
jgi:hypothetical protein